jgi:hypothetical protein
MTDLPSEIRAPGGYDRWLVETSQLAILHSRALLEQTEPLVRAPIRLNARSATLRVPAGAGAADASHRSATRPGERSEI